MLNARTLPFIPLSWSNSSISSGSGSTKQLPWRPIDKVELPVNALSED